MFKLIKNNKIVANLAQSVSNPKRLIQTTLVNNLKKIEKTEDKSSKTITIEGKVLNEDNKKMLKFTDHLDTKHTLKPCAFCELEKKDIYVQYTDVLVLRQFLTDDGHVLSRKITGLCKKQHRKLQVIVKHAKIAGLLLNLQPKLIDGTSCPTDPRARYQHLKWNTYFDDYETMARTNKYL